MTDHRASRVWGGILEAGSILRLRRGSTDTPGTSSARTLDGVILARFDLRGAEADAWEMQVVNPDGTASTLAEAFTVRPVLASLFLGRHHHTARSRSADRCG